MALFHAQTGELRTWARRTLWCVIVIGSLCAIVIPIFSIYRKEGDNVRSVVEVGPQGVSHTGDYIHVVGSVASVDFEDKNFRVHFEFTPHGTLAGDDGVLTSAISVSLFYTTLTFPDAQIMRSVDVTMPYMQGATIDYPFDAYKSYFEILANKDKEQLHKIPVSLTFLGMLQSVEFIPTVHLSNDDLYKISIEIFTRRSPTTIGFSLFIVMIMWALSIAIGIIAIQVIRKYRVTDEHVLTLGITTLFALPALRETQPGIPAIGCAADVLGFYWNMAIIAIASIMILMASALRWKEPSIEKEMELVHKQHDFQSKLISEMAIPMPFPITGGPFYDYQIKKKRFPFMTNHQHNHHHHPTNTDSKRYSAMEHDVAIDFDDLHSLDGREGTGGDQRRDYARNSPHYSTGGHEYYPDSQQGYYYKEEPFDENDPGYQQQHLHPQQQNEERHNESNQGPFRDSEEPSWQQLGLERGGMNRDSDYSVLHSSAASPSNLRHQSETDARVDLLSIRPSTDSRSATTITSTSPTTATGGSTISSSSIHGLSRFTRMTRGDNAGLPSGTVSPTSAGAAAAAAGESGHSNTSPAALGVYPLQHPQQSPQQYQLPHYSGTYPTMTSAWNTRMPPPSLSSLSTQNGPSAVTTPRPATQQLQQNQRGMTTQHTLHRR
ncbi:hypothetical protein EMPS_01129 [Entomortierella parvispora]|uniref:Uncharacterized protein n=1 Tax=Entomortierella parvispora TaxID=205924 RepID=A0A9P3LSA1_9FUNG|nr:hypothetical protein EMPS_01129 [Entomortierella parvispora]